MLSYQSGRQKTKLAGRVRRTDKVRVLGGYGNVLMRRRLDGEGPIVR